MNGVALVAALSLGFAPSAGAASAPKTYGNLPMSFEPNLGQTDPEVAFLVRGQGYGLFLTAGEAVMALNKPSPPQDRGNDLVPERQQNAGSAVVRMKFIDADPAVAIVGLEPLPGVSNYLVGNDRRSWRTHIPHYARVEYKDVYPGVDLAFRGDAAALEYDFVIAPGADPSGIRLSFEGVAGLRIDPEGNLVLDLEGGDEVVQKAPIGYQETGGTRTPVRASYVVDGDCEVSFTVGCHDRGRTLVIDPVLAYSTYLGGVGRGGSDSAADIAVDDAGSAYITGTTDSSIFPTAGPLQASSAGMNDVFVAKLDPAGSALVYSTYLGGSDNDRVQGIAVDTTGSAYIAGYTDSRDFPTVNPLQAATGGRRDAFVAKLNPDGSALAYATYLGGSEYDDAEAIAVDAAGCAYITGATISTDFPIASPLQPAWAGGYDAFVTKLDPAGSSLVYSTYLGGATGSEGGYGIAADGAGNAHVTGYTSSTDFPTANPFQSTLSGIDDAFVAKLSPGGVVLIYSSYLGGTNWDRGSGIAVDIPGNAYVTGFTISEDFPIASPLQATRGAFGSDAFVAKVHPTGSILLYSTYLGGSRSDFGNGIAVDVAGSAYVSGLTASNDFPTASPLQASMAGGPYDAFIAKLDRAGSALVYSTYLGGSDDEKGGYVAVGNGGTAYVTGDTVSIDFPTANPLQVVNAGGNDAFLTKLNPTGSALVYSTYLGGGGHFDRGVDIAVDGAGFGYVAGETSSAVFPTAGAAQATIAGSSDAFVAKLDPAGSTLIFSTYLGGRGEDNVSRIAIDDAGNSYIAGDTYSTDFPTVGPVQATNAGYSDAFLAKLNAAGSSLVYSTYLGGSYDDIAEDMAVDASGNAIITGTTYSTDFPTLSPFQASAAGGYTDAFVTKFNPAGSALVYSTYLGGDGEDQGFGLAADIAGNAFVTGESDSSNFPTANPLQPVSAGYDAFVTKLNPDGSALVYSTYLGGSSGDAGYAITVDDAGSAFVTGYTWSGDFPTANPLQIANTGQKDAFVAKLDPAGSTLVYATYLGGNGDDLGYGIAADTAGNAYVTGTTNSANFPTVHAPQAVRGGIAGDDAFVTKVNPAGSGLVYSTYLGGSGQDSGRGIAVDAAGGAYVTGDTRSTNFPVLGGIRSTSEGEGDAFVTKLLECRPLPGPIVLLKAVKVRPRGVLFSWDPEPDAAAGYRVYAVEAPQRISTANVSNTPVCTAAAGLLSCSHGGGLPAPPSKLFYQALGVCSDGLSEGEL